jgi:uncharacterized protein
MKALLLSLHDVTPRHQSRLERAEELFAALGVPRVTYLLVPRFHGRWAIDEDREFIAWCRRPRAFHIDWCLHGFTHDERTVRPSPASPADWIKRRLLTDGEGEFLALDEADAGQRIDAGARRFTACIGVPPRGFVAPAWLFNRGLIPALRARRFAWTEDRRAVYRLTPSTAPDTIEAPVITWATRTAARRWLSVRLAARRPARPLIRIAVHPHDFDHPGVVESVQRTIAAALQDRAAIDYAVRFE